MRAPVERHRSAVREVDVADQPARAIRPRQDLKRGRVGHHDDVGEARELVDPKAPALDEGGRKDAVAGVEAVDRAGEVRAVVHRRDRSRPGHVLAACDPVLVDENESHRPQPELLDARRDPGTCPRLLIGVKPVPLDETRGSEAETQTVAHVRSSCR